MLVGFLEGNRETWRRYCQFTSSNSIVIKNSSNSKKLALVNYVCGPPWVSFNDATRKMFFQRSCDVKQPFEFVEVIKLNDIGTKIEIRKICIVKD